MKAIGEGFFAQAETLPYQPSGRVIGQMTKESGVSANCRMLLQDEGLDAPEAYLRSALQTTWRGSDVPLVPEVLRQFGSVRRYVFWPDRSWAEFQEAVKRGPAMAMVSRPETPDEAHVLLVDAVEENLVAIRDSLPDGQGAAYRVSVELFWRRLVAGKDWLGPRRDCRMRLWRRA
jgi:hypothetical protein